MPLEPLYICGPTASGKTSLALAVAEAFDGEIVNADAFQVYRGLEVLSAAPNDQERSHAEHHLFGICDLTDKMDAARFAELAKPVIAEIQSRNQLPIIVGGSGLYLKFLTHGVAEAPSADEALRTELDALPVEEILRRLQELDPEEAANQTQQNSQNHRHLSRALEICLLTGEKASDRRKNFAISSRFEELRGVALTWPREILAERIALRTEIMLREGAIEEVMALPPDATTARQAIGVKEIQAHLAGEMTREECLERITISTRQYAKRQRNWFRRESWLYPLDAANDLKTQINEVRELLLQR